MAEKTIVALFDDFDDAQRAVQALEARGIRRSEISIIGPAAQRRGARTAADADSTGTTESGQPVADTEGAVGRSMATGAAAGGVLGGGVGLLAGLGALAIPGIGPVVAAGPLVALLAGAGIGVAAGGLIGALAGAGVPENEAHAYAEGVRRGGTLVTVRVREGDDLDDAVAALQQYSPIDIEERGTLWRESGWERFDETAEPYTAGRLAEERARYGAAPAGAAAPPRTGRVSVYGAGSAPGGGRRR